jgi:hypothetical protein
MRPISMYNPKKKNTLKKSGTLAELSVTSSNRLYRLNANKIHNLRSKRNPSAVCRKLHEQPIRVVGLGYRTPVPLQEYQA